MSAQPPEGNEDATPPESFRALLNQHQDWVRGRTKSAWFDQAVSRGDSSSAWAMQNGESLLRALYATELKLAAREVGEVQRVADVDGAPAAAALDFISEYVRGRTFTCLFDPFAFSGALIATALEELPGATGRACTFREDSKQLGERLIVADRIQWTVSNPFVHRSDLGGVDLMLCAPPMGMSREVDIEELGVRVDQATAMLHRALTDLSRDAEVLLIIPTAQLSASGQGALLPTLARIGWWLDAVVGLPARAMAPLTQIDVSLVVLKASRQEQMFVASFETSENVAAIVRHLVIRSRAKVAEIGRLANREGFISPHALVATERLNQLGQRTGGQPYRIGDIAQLAVHTRKLSNGFEPGENCVYVPSLGTSPAVTEIEAFKISREHYLQLRCQPDLVRAKFLAHILSAQYGRELRATISVGVAHQRIHRDAFANASVYLPPLDMQDAVLNAQQRIDSLKLELGERERDLWQSPRKVKEIAGKIARVNHEDSLEGWMQSLPFPLASILWRYHVLKDIEPKIEHLLFFFEGAAQFVATLLLSAVRSDLTFFAERRSELLGDDLRADTFRAPTFGSWVLLGQRIAGALRRLKSEGEDAALVSLLMRTRNGALIEMLTSKGLFNVLQRVGGWRNEWKGHGGVRSPSELARELGLLEGQVNELRALFSEGFGDYALIRPGASTYDDGVHRYRADALMGRDSVFRQMDVESLDVMSKSVLYMIDARERRPLPLLPFFRLMAPPVVEDNACFFFNRLQGGRERWVSYHFERQGEVTLDDHHLERVINDLTPTSA